MCEAIGPRIHWNERVPVEIMRYYGEDSGKYIISTAPLPALAEPLAFYAGEFTSAPITTSKAELPPACNVHQTVYFPAPHHGLYRATIAGNRLTCEWTGDDAQSLGDVDAAAREIADAFGNPDMHELVIESLPAMHTQKFGKLLPIEERTRKRLLARLTEEHGIYSLGRFATWRNVMLDDVVHDIAVIKRLSAATVYERKLHSFG
jgi:hypothetical protein